MLCSFGHPPATCWGCCFLKFDHFQTWASNNQHVVAHKNKQRFDTKLATLRKHMTGPKMMNNELYCYWMKSNSVHECLFHWFLFSFIFVPSRNMSIPSCGEDCEDPIPPVIFTLFPGSFRNQRYTQLALTRITHCSLVWNVVNCVWSKLALAINLSLSLIRASKSHWWQETGVTHQERRVFNELCLSFDANWEFGKTSEKVDENRKN